MTRPTHQLSLGIFLALLWPGCGGTGVGSVDLGDADLGDADLGDTDQGTVASCGDANGGCSISPLVLCGTASGGAVLCGACPTGYTGDGRVCTSVTAMDECALNTDNCSPNALCVDTVGSFTCTCARGFSGDGVTCVHQECNSAVDCDDEVPCTVDSCSASGSCLHAPDNDLCPNNGVCSPARGCVTGVICGSPSDCVDSDPCTRDEVCDTSSATCTFELLDSDDDGEIPLVCGGTDCNDARRSVGAGATEVCNGVDDNCNGIIDADVTIASQPLTLLNSESSCGACGNVCAQGQSCYLGACVACGGSVGAPCCGTFFTGPTATSGGTCSNGGGCVATPGSSTCAASCGAVGESCCNGDTCDFGVACVGNSCADPSVVTCADAGAAVLYRLGTVDVPTPAQANNGDTVGHNIDGRGDICGVPDYAGGVDNSLIDLAAALPSLTPSAPFRLQDEFDQALNCTTSGSGCTRLDLIVSVRVGTGCALMEILDGTDAGSTSLTGPFGATLGPSGDFIGRPSHFALSLPVWDGGTPLALRMHLSGVIISGVRTDTALAAVTLGGALLEADATNTFTDLALVMGDGVSTDDIFPIYANLRDVMITNSCSAVSMGFTANGAVVVP